MERYTKQIRRTLGLLSSMVRSGENHSEQSEKALRNSLNGLEQLDLYIVSNSEAKLKAKERLKEIVMQGHDEWDVTEIVQLVNSL